ncbi:hypothetical protein BGX27_006077, partial [Mortierella sp. AM989]
DSGRHLLKQEYARLNKEWTRDADLVEDFWEKLRDIEIEREEARINKERMLHLKRNAAEQLNMTVEDYTCKTRRSLDKANHSYSNADPKSFHEREEEASAVLSAKGREETTTEAHPQAPLHP